MSEKKTTFDVLCDAIKPEKGELQKSEKLFVRLCALVFEENGYRVDNSNWKINRNDNTKLLGLDFQKKLLDVCNNIPDSGKNEINKLMSQADIDKNKAWLTKWGTKFIEDFVNAIKEKLPSTPNDWTIDNIKDIFKKHGTPIIKKYTEKGKLSGFANIFSGYWSGLERFANGKDAGTFEFIKFSCKEIKKDLENKVKKLNLK